MKLISTGLLLCFAATAAAANEPVSKATESVLKELKRLEKRIEPTGQSVTMYEQLDPMAVKQAHEINLRVQKFTKAIYLIDDRKNYYEVGSISKAAADATVILVEALSVNSNADGSVTLPSRTAGLCTPDQIQEITDSSGQTYKKEPFYDEPAPGFCSGVKIGKDLIATAGHCIRSAAHCRRTKFVSGFYKTAQDTQPNLTIPAGKVYSCKALIARKLEGGSDWAIVQVDRELSGMPTATLAEKTIKKEDGVTVVGYPMGLPVKIASNGHVRKLENSYFVANLDTYGGNSGSPVFNTSALVDGKLVIEGILVRGEDDFIEVSSPCRISKRCAFDGCRGEDVVYADEFKGSIPSN